MGFLNKLFSGKKSFSSVLVGAQNNIFKIYGVSQPTDAQKMKASVYSELASTAKAKARDMLELVSNEAIQMHGGIGMTDEADIGLFLKRARVAQQILGDAIYHRDRYTTLIRI